MKLLKKSKPPLTGGFGIIELLTVITVIGIVTTISVASLSTLVMEADVAGLTSATTVQGSDITITVGDNGVMIDGANVILTDIETSNGVIHVIDTVLIP